MTVDAYVYLYWDTDTMAQVDAAFQRVSGYPMGRMWLDIEAGSPAAWAPPAHPAPSAGRGRLPRRGRRLRHLHRPGLLEIAT